MGPRYANSVSADQNVVTRGSQEPSVPPRSSDTVDFAESWESAVTGGAGSWEGVQGSVGCGGARQFVQPRLSHCLHVSKLFLWGAAPLPGSAPTRREFTAH